MLSRYPDPVPVYSSYILRPKVITSARAIGASMLRCLFLSPFHALVKNSLAQYVITGRERKMMMEVRVVLMIGSRISPPEKYSGKLIIIMLAKQKPARPILYHLVRSICLSCADETSSRLRWGSYPMCVSVSTTCLRDIRAGSKTMKTSFFVKLTREDWIAGLIRLMFSNSQRQLLQCICGR